MVTIAPLRHCSQLHLVYCSDKNEELAANFLFEQGVRPLVHLPTQRSSVSCGRAVAASTLKTTRCQADTDSLVPC